MITKEDIEYLRQLCRDGSPGPWEADIDDPFTDRESWTGNVYTGDGIWRTRVLIGKPLNQGDSWLLGTRQDAQNARLACAARTWLPRLLDELERQQANTEAARAAIKRRRCR